MVWWFPSAAAGARRGAYPLEPMEYVFTEGTAAPYDVMYDTVQAAPSPVSVAQSAISTPTGRYRSLVRTSDGTLYVAYFKLLAGKYQIYVIKSEDDGATWIDDTHISTDMATFVQSFPAIAVDSSDNLHVVWQGTATGFAQQIWYALYDGSWNTPVRISTAANMTTSTQSYSAIAVDSDDNLHVVWSGVATDFATSQIRYATAVPPYAAGDWVTPIRISVRVDMEGYHQQPPAIAVDSNNYLHVVWYGRTSVYTTLTQLWYALYDGSWYTPVRISTAANMGGKSQGNPSIAVDSDDNLHAVWHGAASDFPATNQIRYATAVPPYAAGDWVTPVRISDALNMATYNQQYPSIAVDSSDSLYVVWQGKATGYTTQDVVWLAVYVVSWATPVCIQPTGRNQYPNLRWSRWPR